VRKSFAESPLKYGYARVSTDGQSIDAQVRQLRAAGARQVFREVASGAKTDRAQLRRALAQFDAGDGTGFQSLGDTWADTTTPHGRLMLTVRASPSSSAS
jgi:DNA invertase Pin-like site-specific DNA recombinase